MIEIILILHVNACLGITKMLNIFKNKKVLLGAIGINVCIFMMGFVVSDISLMVVSLGSSLLCYIGYCNNSKE